MEAADSPSTSSKVIVQCTDPHGLFEKILPDLLSRQTLGNLHWKSSTRPLRSIDRLDVSFTREEKHDDALNSTRRHQIPGLRQTPFVKVLLLRCDDRETYKETTRKEVKQWLKSQGLSTDGRSSAKGQESHDAFEHMILHVVLPNTPAAAQPKSSKHISVDANESTDSVNSKTKWPGKGSSTIYDKLRADFSSSSKAPFERIAQVRILDPDARPVSVLSPAENSELWQDFIDKLKAAILASFDIRVAQYEDDIKDRDSQRSLPGWNFCTFFVLKEGLARGFENVGLLEDAMTVYDELDAGLDGVVQEQGAQGDVDTAGSLLPFSRDLKPAIRSALDTLQHDPPDSIAPLPELDLFQLVEFEREFFPFDIAKLDYQQRILTNQVSALELRLYLFTRKLHLLFRRSRSVAGQAKVKSTDDPWKQQHDLNSVADIAEKTLTFVALGARALHQDLHSAWGGYEGLGEEDRNIQKRVIGNLVASWKFSALMQIVHDCHLAMLLPMEQLSPTNETVQLNGHKNGHTLSQDTQDTSRRAVAEEKPGPLTPDGRPSAPEILEHRQSTLISLQQSSQPQANNLRTNAREQLALWTAELCIRARGIIADIIPETMESSIFKRGLTNTIQDGQTHMANGGKRTTAGLQSPCLKLALASTKTCAGLFKMFTVYAFQCYSIARQKQASRQMILSLAERELSQSFPSRAVQWLQHISDISNLEVRSLTDFSVLVLYMQSLKRLNQPSAYAKSLLSVIAACSSSMGMLAVRSAGINLQQLLNEFLAASQEVKPCEMTFSHLFAIHSTDKSIHHIDQKDGFAIALSLHMRVAASMLISHGMVLNMAATQQTEPEMITLRAKSEIRLSSDATRLVFESNSVTHGWYDFNSLIVRVGNITFRHEFSNARFEQDIYRSAPSTHPPVMLYSRAGSLSIKAYPAPSIDLTDTTYIRIGVGAGDDSIQRASIRLKPYTAGVRLNIQAAELQDGDGVDEFKVSQDEKGTCIELRNLDREHVAVFDVPYSMDKALLKHIEVKFEVSYLSKGCIYELFCTESISSTLPITINVQDIFQIDGLYSRFTAGPATEVPIQVVRWQIEDNDLFEVQTSEQFQEPVQTFPKIHTSWVSRIVKKPGQANTDRTSKMPLAVEYQCLDDQILSVIEEQLQADLETGPLASVTTLLTRHLTSHIPRLWTESELETIALLQEISMWSYEEMEWKEVLRALSGKERSEAEAWLRTWHQKHAHITLPHSQTCTRLLRLVVDIPQPALVIAVELQLRCEVPDTIIVGRPVEAEVIISCARHTLEDLLIEYEVNGQVETWLVGGRKRGTLHASSGKIRYGILLIAQRSGHVLVPSIDVRVRRVTESHDLPTPIFEVDHKSQAKCVLAIPAVQTTTIALNPSPTGAGYVVVNSRRM